MYRYLYLNEQRRKLLIIAMLYIRFKKRMRRSRRMRAERYRRRAALRHTAESSAPPRVMTAEEKLRDRQVFFDYHRMNRETFQQLLSLIKPSIAKQDTNFRLAITASVRLSITLRYLATGVTMVAIAEAYNCSHSIVSKIVEDTCTELWTCLQPVYLKPPSASEWCQIADGFQRLWHFPNCLGAIDGRLVPVCRNDNIFFLAIADTNYCFTMVDICAYGDNSEIDMYAQSNLRKSFAENDLELPEPKLLPGGTEDVPFVLLGNEAFPLKQTLLKPYPERGLTEEMQVYNNRLALAHLTIDNAIGILASRWQVFHRIIIAGKTDKVGKMVQAACVLHNFLMKTEMEMEESERLYCPPKFADYVEGEDNNVHEGTWRDDGVAMNPVTHLGGHRYSAAAGSIRDSFKEYFISIQNSSVANEA